MNDSSPVINLGEAASRFLASLEPEESKNCQAEVHRFVQWYSRVKSMAGLAAPEVANYAERLSLSDIDYDRKLEQIKAFLVYAKKEGWIKINLATHLKAKKAKNKKAPVSRKNVQQKIAMTGEGYAELEAELENLRSKRIVVIDEVRQAAADKDFRENAPLDAARERHGHIEGRIRELEEAVKLANVIDEQRNMNFKVSIGDNVKLEDLESGEELTYKIVSRREVDPSRGKISDVSPVGKAVLGGRQGDTVEVNIPAGKLSYKIRQIER